MADQERPEALSKTGDTFKTSGLADQERDLKHFQRPETLSKTSGLANQERDLRSEPETLSKTSGLADQERPEALSKT